MDDSIQQPEILVVDDEESVREMLQHFLESNRFSCACATSGEEALERIEANSFDLILLDIKMPGVSGMEVLEKVHGEDPTRCVIMLTAVSDLRTAVEAMQLGAVDYVVKPFSLKELLDKIEKALAKSAALKTEVLQRQIVEQEMEGQRHMLEQRAREVQGLNNLIQRYLLERSEYEERWKAISNEINRLKRQIELMKIDRGYSKN